MQIHRPRRLRPIWHHKTFKENSAPFIKSITTYVAMLYAMFKSIPNNLKVILTFINEKIDFMSKIKGNEKIEEI